MTILWELIIGSIYFFLPAGVANMTPVFLTKITGKQGRPIDAGKTFGGKPIFGSHKSWRGLIAGTIAGFLFFLVQVWLYRFPAIQAIAVIDYRSAPVILGAALGLGALCGDLVKSFFKRRVNVQPGRPWIPFDQVDFVVGGLVFTLPFVTLGWPVWAIVIGTFFVLHFVVNILGWALGVKENVL